MSAQAFFFCGGGGVPTTPFPSPRDRRQSPPSSAVALPPPSRNDRGRVASGHCKWRISATTAARTNGVATVVVPPPGVYRMRNFLEVEMKVRDYELDQFGVVNHAVYINYCQQGRIEILERMGVSRDDVTSSGESLATSEISVKFIAPLRGSDRFIVKARISHSSAARVIFEHFIFKLPNLEPILEAKAIGVWLNKSYRPVRIPSYFLTKILQIDAYLEEFNDTAS